MASYLRPRRGKRATAESQAIVLKRGEVFFECPDSGVGTGAGKIKVGDGSTKYASLPYFMQNFDLNADDATIAFTDTSTATAYTNNATYLSNIKPANSLKTIFTNLKQLLFNYNAQLTELNNELALVAGSTGVSHNGIFRGKDLGTISSLNEYIAFRSAHGIDNKTYTDLYLGDYFKIQDGTYNAVWMVAHFDYYYNRGDVASARGVLLIPRTVCGESKMANTNDTTGAYASSIANVTTCPAIASKLQTVLGSYLLSNKLLLSNATNASTVSMAGAGYTGASTNWAWTASQCVLPNEIQIYGSTVFSSSFYDVGEACEKLAVFNFINHIEYSRSHFWLRAVASATRFAFATSSGDANSGSASASLSLRPLIYIG
ncbi:MAG: hypothetical protein IKR19_08465 [Acholeplasmatales bacterium]|nr:hypothetical protein [Acholeplasmatales bacterium]